MSEENRIGTYQFVAEPFHVDFHRFNPWGAWYLLYFPVQLLDALQAV